MNPPDTTPPADAEARGESAPPEASGVRETTEHGAPAQDPASANAAGDATSSPIVPNTAEDRESRAIERSVQATFVGMLALVTMAGMGTAVYVTVTGTNLPEGGAITAIFTMTFLGLLTTVRSLDFSPRSRPVAVSKPSTVSVSTTAEIPARRRARQPTQADVVLSDLVARLRGEIRSLTTRTWQMLIFGILFGLIGVTFLVATDLLREPGPGVEVTPLEILRLASRTSIAIVIEVLAFFFLRMYRRGLDDLKYLHNELTTVQMKWAALVAAQARDLDKYTAAVVIELARTDRTTRLSVGETTAELEREKVDQATVKAALDVLRQNPR